MEMIVSMKKCCVNIFVVNTSLASERAHYSKPTFIHKNKGKCIIPLILSENAYQHHHRVQNHNAKKGKYLNHLHLSKSYIGYLAQMSFQNVSTLNSQRSQLSSQRSKHSKSNSTSLVRKEGYTACDGSSK